jgi:hypothetical protein
VTRRPHPICYAAIALVVLWASTCHGQDQQLTDPRIRITVTCSDGTRNIGSGTMIGWGEEPRLALTAGHLFRGGVRSISACVGDACYPAELLGRDEKDDLAAIRVRGLTRYGVFQVTETDPPIGAGVSLHGYGNTQIGERRSFDSRVAGYGGFDRTDDDGAMLLTAPVREGDSGGPVLTAEGVAGVIVATDSPHATGQAVSVAYECGTEWKTAATACCRIRGFLGRLFRPRRYVTERIREPYADENGILPKWKNLYPGVVLPGPICPGGSCPVTPVDPPTVDPAVPPVDIDVPTPDEDTPLPPTPDQSPCAGIEALAAELAAIRLQLEGLKGEKGDKGDKGEPGTPGTSPTAAEVAEDLKADSEFLARVAKLVKVEPIDPATLPPIYFRHIDGETGEVFKPEEPVHLGGGYEFVRFPIDWAEAAKKIAPHLPKSEGK